MNKQYFILLSIFLIKANDAKNCNKLDTNVNHCPAGRVWLHQKIMNNCVKMVTKSYDWEKARKYCETSLDHGLLVSAVPYKELDQLKAYTKFASTNGQYWIGVNDAVSEGKYMYANGYQMKANWWNTKGKKKEPNGGKKENCLFITGQSRKLADAMCQDPRSFFCQTESQIGPRELKIEMNWHDAGKKVYYKGYKASVACSVFSPLNDHIGWTVRKGNSRVDVSKLKQNFTTKSNLEINELGKCRNKTYSILSFTADDRYIGLNAVCWPRPPGRVLCPKNSHRLTYCQHAEKVQISSAVRGSPTIQLSHPGQPGPAIFNTTIIMKCVVLTDGTQQSIFLINYATGPVKPKPSYLHREVKDLPNRGKTDILTLNLPFEEKHADVTFSCFVNDVVASKMNTKCHSDNPFCAELTVISTSSKGAKKGPRNTQLDLESDVIVKPNYFYEGTVLDATCSALDAYQGTLRWKAFDLSKKEVNFTRTILSANLSHTTENGEKKTESKLSISVNSMINGTQFSCYSDSFPHKSPCEYKQPKYKFCDAADMFIIVVDKPDRPNLTLAYTGYPLVAARHGSTLTADCAVYSRSTVFVLNWIIYDFDINGTIIVNRRSSIVKTYQRYAQQKIRKDNSHYTVHWIESTLTIPLDESMDGMSIACLAYDINLDKVDDVCTLRDDLCNKSKSVKVLPLPKLPKPPNKELANKLKFITIAIGILMLLLLALILWHMYCGKTSEAEDIRSGKEANGSLQDNLPPEYSRRVSIGTGTGTDVDDIRDLHAGTEMVTATETETTSSQGTSRQSGTSTDIDIATPLKIPDKKGSDQRLKRTKKRQSKADNRKSLGYTDHYNLY